MINISLINTMNNVGEEYEPWGTPPLIQNSFDETPSTIT